MRALLLVLGCIAGVGSLVACGGSDGGSPQGDLFPPDPSATDRDSGANDSAPSSGDAGKPDADGRTDADSGADAAPFTPAQHPPFPLLVKGGAGGVLTSPVIVPIFFPGYDHTAEVKDQLQKMGTVGTYWHDAISEYGVTGYTYGTPVDLTEQAPASIGSSAIHAWLEEKLSGAYPEFGTPTSQSIYVIYYPSTTAVQGSCSDPASGGGGFGGYHDALSAGNGATVAYGVIAECANFGPAVTTSLDMVTIAGSHEIIEAATDTVPGRGYAQIDHNGFALDIVLQGNEENGDLCAVNDGYIRPGNGYPYMLQRGWSNKAAAAGLDPCQPALPDQPFVGAAPILPDTVHAAGRSGPGVIIPVGQSKTIDVVLWSTGPTPPFTVAAKQQHGVSSLDFTWDKTAGKNGDRLKLTIKVNSAGSRGYETFVVTAQLNAEARPIWAGIVTN